MNEKFQHRIDLYLSGEMYPDEVREFMEEVERNSELKEQLEITKSAQLALESIDFDEKLDFVKGLEGGDDSAVPIYSRRRRWIWLGGVAASVLLIGLFFWNSANQERIRRQEIIDEHFVHVDSGLNLLRSNDNSISISQQKLEALSHYDIRSYELSAPLLEKVFLTEQDSFSLLLAGVSYLNSLDVEKAKEIFNLICYTRDIYPCQEFFNTINKLENETKQ